MEAGREIWTAYGSAVAPGLTFILLTLFFPPAPLTAATAVLTSTSLTLLFSKGFFRVWVQASLLGSVFFLSIYLTLYLIIPTAFGLYLAFFCFFHWSEYMATALWSPGNLKPSSFLLNHSREYWIAALASWMEFWLEFYFFPSWKECWSVVLLGSSLCFIGEAIRLCAMRTAGKSFSHIVQDSRGEEQDLVQEGLYAWVRHPAYTGWYMWSVGTQIVLVNPVCTVGYSIVVWNFFKERIFFEEYALIHNIFGIHS